MIFLLNVHNQKLINRKHQTNPNSESSLQNNRPTIFKSVKVVKAKEIDTLRTFQDIDPVRDNEFSTLQNVVDQKMIPKIKAYKQLLLF